MSAEKDKQKLIGELEAEIAAMEREAGELQKQATELIQKEAEGQGLFAQEIFRLGQKRRMLHTEIQHRRVRINYLLLGL